MAGQGIQGPVSGRAGRPGGGGGGRRWAFGWPPRTLCGPDTGPPWPAGLDVHMPGCRALVRLLERLAGLGKVGPFPQCRGCPEEAGATQRDVMKLQRNCGACHLDRRYIVLSKVEKGKLSWLLGRVRRRNYTQMVWLAEAGRQYRTREEFRIRIRVSFTGSRTDPWPESVDALEPYRISHHQGEGGCL